MRYIVTSCATPVSEGFETLDEALDFAMKQDGRYIIGGRERQYRFEVEGAEVVSMVVRKRTADAE